GRHLRRDRLVPSRVPERSPLERVELRHRGRAPPATAGESADLGARAYSPNTVTPTVRPRTHPRQAGRPGARQPARAGRQVSIAAQRPGICKRGAPGRLRPMTTRMLGVIGIVAAAAIVSHATTFSGDFVLDDRALIVNNAALRSGWEVPRYFTRGL